MAALVFVDTNIFLDFYRVQGNESSLTILDQFDTNHDRIITTTQVEMEYKNNRQRVILESLRSITKPSSELVIPAFLRESQLSKSIKSTQKQLLKLTAELGERTALLLRDPVHNDPVYRSLQKYFGSKAACHFHSDVDHHIRGEIEEKAHQRFLMGYPPRKNDDTSIGDSINWEWLIYCANKFSSDIIIVSRDTDFGLLYEKDSNLNDWLQQEFKERVSGKHSVSLTTKLTDGFKKASIPVTSEEEHSEQQLFEMIETRFMAPVFTGLTPPLGATDVMVTPTFVWNSVVGANSYEFEIAEEIGQTDKFYLKDEVAGTTVNAYKLLENLKYDKQYWWRVRSVNSAGVKSAWTISFFTTKTFRRLED